MGGHSPSPLPLPIEIPAPMEWRNFAVSPPLKCADQYLGSHKEENRNGPGHLAMASRGADPRHHLARAFLALRGPDHGHSDRYRCCRRSTGSAARELGFNHRRWRRSRRCNFGPYAAWVRLRPHDDFALDLSECICNNRRGVSRDLARCRPMDIVWDGRLHRWPASQTLVFRSYR